MIDDGDGDSDDHDGGRYHEPDHGRDCPDHKEEEDNDAQCWRSQRWPMVVVAISVPAELHFQQEGIHTWFWCYCCFGENVKTKMPDKTLLGG